MNHKRIRRIFTNRKIIENIKKYDSNNWKILAGSVIVISSLIIGLLNKNKEYMRKEISFRMLTKMRRKNKKCYIKQINIIHTKKITK